MSLSTPVSSHLGNGLRPSHFQPPVLTGGKGEDLSESKSQKHRKSENNDSDVEVQLYQKMETKLQEMKDTQMTPAKLIETHMTNSDKKFQNIEKFMLRHMESAQSQISIILTCVKKNGELIKFH